MTIDNERKNNIQNWTTLSAHPPLKETEALRYINDYENGHAHIDALIVSRLYSLIAYHRLNRTIMNHDKIAEEFISKAKSTAENDSVVLELQELLNVRTHLQMLEGHTFKNYALHETDHQSVKRKKLQQILEKVEPLEEKWSTEFSYSGEGKETPVQTLFEKGQYLFNELIQEIGPHKRNETNGFNHVSIMRINQLLRELDQLTNELEKFLPGTEDDHKGKDPLKQLDSMVGLSEVKSYIHRYYHYLKYQQYRKDIGFQMVDEPELHMIITGNPGTGKTTIARLLANIYYDLGLLDTRDVIEVNRSHLVGSYVGQTEENTMNYVQQAIGGILFIDEAYSLQREGQTGNDYGQAVIDTLVSAMTSKEYGDKFAVILAGYPDEMRQFLWGNPGLRSRFPEQNHVHLPNYSIPELIEIGEQTALENDYFFTEKAVQNLERSIDKQQVDDTFGNARAVRNIVLQTIFQKGASESDQADHESKIDLMRIEEKDFSSPDSPEEDNKSPMERLEQLIGLKPVKDEVKKLSSFVRLQRKREDKGLPSVPIQLHAVFSGNPGTGKTTVAHIYADILKECGLLKRGHVIVASRSDLVAGYVGQTSIKTKKKIREALGGVLFIDEAYSLFQSGSNDFGKEAIDTLVDEMTKHNENLVVILAGYKREMSSLIQSNPGLSSRFKKFLHFPDYSPRELVEMTKYQASTHKYVIEPDALSFLDDVYETHSIDGNGRYVKNLVDEAIQYQALRIDEQDEEGYYDVLSKPDLELAWNAMKGREIG
ncbi:MULTISPECIES: AAA family ATPase [Pontibacillus]|uniref:AAA family ATPase n=1 Tax=Pontibacillus chungwhensis TaxID=265426 RepID=A0ABY8V2W7_9BACI|nr:MULTISPECIES: AAA family ATPase [Pontibacillus]MCD5322800.1 AAA family ATPase [Pontibacillus sp. HN14]WIG00070.1 AAA family ATPase [Pontibacillus chungwhensis]